MGLFEQLGVNVEDLPEVGYARPKDGFYDFEITEVTLRQGTKADPNVTKLTIEYSLDEAGSTTEWFTIAEDGDSSTDKAQKGLRFLADRLKDLGIDPNEFDPEEEQLTGVRGSLELFTNKGGYQNVRNVVAEGAVSDDPSDYDDGSKEQDAAIKRRVAANRAARSDSAKAAPAKTAPRRPAPKDVDEENPFE